MKLKFILALSPFFLSACTSMYLPRHTGESDAEIAQRRAEIRAMEMQDYQDERRKRQDAIEDLGTMQMNEAKAIDRAYKNRSKQNIYLVH
ncbi:hypothetical protein [Glaesserella sp.]|uniref:hypothetical protein n=1 Tax=Glaesserella sp. TaxID=2094731 RepID=UPI0035A07C47